MIQSMTGFGSSEKNGFRVEIRSLNHRFMEISMKLPPLLSEHDIPLRKMLKEKFARGKFDVSVIMANEDKAVFKIDPKLAAEAYEELKSLQAELSIPGTIDIQTLLNYKEFFIAGSQRQEYDGSLLYAAFNEALEQLEKMRAEEGQAMAEDISNVAGRLKSLWKELSSLAPDVVADYKNKFYEKLKTLPGEAEYDRDRVSQEIAIMIEKSDIAEEVTRIETHISQFGKILQSGDIIGKQLDFLLQELNREVNTAGSKSGDSRIANIVIGMKSEIEKMREQVQNIQ